jgi:hypothetical protein
MDFHEPEDSLRCQEYFSFAPLAFTVKVACVRVPYLPIVALRGSLVMVVAVEAGWTAGVAPGSLAIPEDGPTKQPLPSARTVAVSTRIFNVRFSAAVKAGVLSIGE